MIVVNDLIEEIITEMARQSSPPTSTPPSLSPPTSPPPPATPCISCVAGRQSNQNIPHKLFSPTPPPPPATPCTSPCVAGRQPSQNIPQNPLPLTSSPLPATPCIPCVARRQPNQNIPHNPLPPTSHPSLIHSLVEEILEDVSLLGTFNKMRKKIEDTHCEMTCLECETELEMSYKEDCKECGPGMITRLPKMTLVGMDAVALFPSLTGKRTGRTQGKKKSKLWSAL